MYNGLTINQLTDYSAIFPIILCTVSCGPLWTVESGFMTVGPKNLTNCALMIAQNGAQTEKQQNHVIGAHKYPAFIEIWSIWPHTTEVGKLFRGRHGFDGSGEPLGACRGSDYLVNPAENL